MTSKEKISKDIDSRPREKKIEEIMEAICDWDIDTLVDFVQGDIGDKLEKLSDKDLGDEYYEWFSHRYETSDAFKDDTVDGIFEELTGVPCIGEELCGNERCGKMKDSGAACWWCGK